MLELPEEYRNTVNDASITLSDTAKVVMFVAQMLGNDVFELDTVDGFKIKITVN